MKAIQVTQYGGPSALTLKELPSPKPSAHQALVGLKAAGVNFIDIYQRTGRYLLPLPFTPGQEGSGIVLEVGAEVRNFKVGDHVAYTGQLGSYAEQNLVDVEKLIHLPQDFSFEQGAAFPLQGMTAHYLLHEFHRIQAGETILIHAAAGGMGLLLVQWAKKLGARVIGTTSTEEKAALAKSQGADEIILYNDVAFPAEVKRLTEGKGADFIIDGVGKTTFPGNLEAIKVRGHIVIFGSASGAAEPIGPNSLQAKSITISGGSLGNFMKAGEELATRASAVVDGIQKGWLKLKIDQVIPLSQVSKAHELLENRKTTGKLVLRTDS